MQAYQGVEAIFELTEYENPIFLPTEIMDRNRFSHQTVPDSRLK